MKISLCSWCKLARRDKIYIMSDETLLKLAKNPHYKMNAEQKNQLARIKAVEKPVVEFGTPDLHNNEFEKHDTKVVKKRRYGKKQI